MSAQRHVTRDPPDGRRLSRTGALAGTVMWNSRECSSRSSGSEMRRPIMASEIKKSTPVTRVLIAGALLVSAAGGFARPAEAAVRAGTPVVVATGLDSPRGLTFGP